MTVPRPARNWWAETKPFYLTSEFAIWFVLTIALLITCAVDNSLDSRFFWRTETFLTIGYLLARGLAKSGTRWPGDDPRNQP